ncbi:hypothetical protein BJ165DRAFT_1312983, partial [Panaeolus papilionaceus]
NTNARPNIDATVGLNIAEQTFTYKLRGIVYYGHSHFISTLIDNNDSVWVYDGITNNGISLYIGKLNDI